MKTTNVEPELYRVDEAQRILGFGATTIRAMIRDGELPVVRITRPGGKRAMIRVSRQAIDDFIRSRTETGEGN